MAHHRLLYVSVASAIIVIIVLSSLVTTGIIFPKTPKVSAQFQIVLTTNNGTNLTLSLVNPGLLCFGCSGYTVTSSSNPLSVWSSLSSLSASGVVFNTLTVNWLATYTISPSSGFGWLGIGHAPPANVMVNPAKSYSTQAAVAQNYNINVTSSANPYCAWNQPALPTGTCFFIAGGTTPYNTTAVPITSGTAAVMYSESYTQAQMLGWFTDANYPTLTTGQGYQLCAYGNPMNTAGPAQIIAYGNTVNSASGASSYVIPLTNGYANSFYCFKLAYNSGTIGSLSITGVILSGSKSTT